MDPSDLDEEMAKYDGVEDFSTLNVNAPEELPQGAEAVLDTWVTFLVSLIFCQICIDCALYDMYETSNLK